MTRKQKQSNKVTKSSKLTKGPAQPEEESDTAITSGVVETPQREVAVAQEAPVTQPTHALVETPASEAKTTHAMS